MAFTKVRIEEFDPYIIVHEDALNWVLYERVSKEKDGEVRVKEQRLSYHHSLKNVLTALCTYMADSAHVTTVEGYMDTLQEVFDNIAAHSDGILACLKVEAEVPVKKTKRAKKESVAPATPTPILLEEE